MYLGRQIFTYRLPIPDNVLSSGYFFFGGLIRSVTVVFGCLVASLFGLN